MTTYTWTDNAMQGGGACDVDKVNDNLMHLKYDNVSPQDGKVPYSAVSGKVDANGYASFISKIDNSSIKIEAGSSNPNLVIAYPDGSLETISADYTISSISSDGTYTVIKEKGQNPLVTTKTITEDIKAPTSPVDGDYWLNIGVKPMVPYKRVAGAWVATQYTKLGEFTRTSGTIGTPVSYAFNGKFIKSQSCPATNTTTNIVHNINSKNIKITHYLVCKTTEGGFAVGEKGIVSGFYNGAQYIPLDPITIPNNNSIDFISGNSGLYLVNKTNRQYINPTAANWDLQVIIERSF
ncbi:MAG: hypothetical protein A2Y25_02080 [Candidatus Melainabacteria bacterium GWF2_37_15]|nr:MAG: hypothetical protein A2Y25_02080 [Candidatus Melainabacteria bacterium GWF2_37_15]